MCRHLYNWALKERTDAYEKEQKTVTYLEQQNNLPLLKKQRPWFKGVYSLVLQDVLRRLDTAYKKFFKEKRGFPNYRKKGQYTSITYTQHRSMPKDGYVTIPKIGKVAIKYHREIPDDAELKTLTIIKEGSKWFCSFSIELKDLPESKPNVKSAIGIDLGLENFIYCSDGQSFDALKAFRAYQKNLGKLQKKLQKAKKRTKRYRKILKALQKAFYRIKCKRKGYHHYLAGKLLKISDLIFVEDLAISNMVRRPKPKIDEETGKYLPNGAFWKRGMNKSILDAAWGRFLLLLKCRAENVGKHVISVNPKNTTQRCCNCGMIVKKTLKDRIHVCPNCGIILPRDYNSAIEVLRLGLESLDFTLEVLEAPTIMQSI